MDPRQRTLLSIILTLAHIGVSKNSAPLTQTPNIRAAMIRTHTKKDSPPKKNCANTWPVGAIRSVTPGLDGVACDVVLCVLQELAAAPQSPRSYGSFQNSGAPLWYIVYGTEYMI